MENPQDIRAIAAGLDPSATGSRRGLIREARALWRETRGAEVIEDGIPAGPAGSTCRASHGFGYVRTRPHLHRTRFTLLPNAHALVLGVALSAAGVCMSYVGISGLIGTKVLGAAPPGAFGGAIILLMGLALDLFGPLTLLAGACAAGSITVRNDLGVVELGPPRFRRRSVPSADVRAVQLCSGGILTLETKRGRPVQQKETWQANLVLGGGDVRRINLADNGRRPAVERFARALAEAIGAPFLDHSRVQSATPDPTPPPSLQELYQLFRSGAGREPGPRLDENGEAA